MNDEPNEKFDDLTRDVDVQLHSLLSYISKSFQASTEDGERVRMSPSELVAQNVLEAFLCLAESFYEEFRNDLKTTYEQNSDDKASGERLLDADVTILMQKALDKLAAEWTRVYGFIAATEARTTSETHKIMSQLSPLIRAASQEVGFSPELFPVIPQFGTVYSLGFFNYTDDFMALNLPITALQSPWEWTIFWHEIAGQKVRLLKKGRMEFQNMVEEMFREMDRKLQQYSTLEEKQKAVDDFKQNLGLWVPMILGYFIPLAQISALTTEQITTLYEALTNCVYEDYMDNQNLSTIALNKTLSFIQDLSPLRSSFPIVMFSFEDLLSDIQDELRLQQKTSVMDKLRDAHREALKINKRGTVETEEDAIMVQLFNAWEKALSLEENLTIQKRALAEEGWSADWLEELFEDSFSVINFDFDFLTIFDKLLHRHADGGKDLRHPPHNVRLAVAAALKLIGFDPTLTEQDPPQADSFPAGLSDEAIAIVKKYYPGSLSTDSQAVVWRIAKKFQEMHRRMKMQEPTSDESIQRAKAAISGAMKTHMTTKLNTAESITILVNTVMKSLGGDITNELRKPQGMKGTRQNNPIAQYNDYRTKIDTLIHGRNIIGNEHKPGYRELMDLSFSDVDFLGTTITDVELNGQRTNWAIRWMNVLSSGVKDSTLLGPVTYKVDGRPRGTTIVNWNADFGRSQYKL